MIDHFSIESCVRGYQVYKDIWEASVGEKLHATALAVKERYKPRFLLSPLLSSLITAREMACDRGPIDTGHCQWDLGT